VLQADFRRFDQHNKVILFALAVTILLHHAKLGVQTANPKTAPAYRTAAAVQNSSKKINITDEGTHKSETVY